MEVTHAFADLEELVRSPSSLQIRLVPEPAVATRGETCRLSWIVEGADEVRLWYTDVRPSAPAPTDWYRVFEEGEPVSAEDERKLPLDQDTAFFMLARAGSQIRGERVLVEIHREPQRIEAEIGCAPTERILEKMTFTPHVALLEEHQLRTLDKVYAPAPPLVRPARTSSDHDHCTHTGDFHRRGGHRELEGGQYQLRDHWRDDRNNPPAGGPG